MNSSQKLFILLISVVIYSCSKEDETIETIKTNEPVIEIPVSNNFFPLDIGNYWVYEFKTRMPDGSITSGKIDTLRVISDTLINDLKYFVLNTNQPNFNSKWIIRDSAGYILSTKSQVMLTPAPASKAYNSHYGFFTPVDTAYYYWDEFPRVVTVNTKQGTFDCLEQLTNHQLYSLGNKLLIDTSFFASIGPVQRSFSYSSGAQVVGEIIDYHLEEQ